MRASAGEIIHLTSAHRPFDTRVFQKECRSLAEAGYRVTLVAPHTHDEVKNGVRIRAVPMPENGKDRLKTTTRLVYRAALAENRDAVFHFHDPELLPFMFLLKVRGRRVVYDAHEDTPLQILYQHWIPRRLRKPVSLAMRALEAIGGRLFDRIVTVNDTIAKRFLPRKTLVVPNYPLRSILDISPEMPYSERPAHIAYAGGLTEVRGVREMIGAVQRLPSGLSPTLVLAGAFYPAELEEEMRAAKGWDRVDYHGWTSQVEVARLLNGSRVGLVLLHPTEQYRDSFPTKLFEYMAAGLPVVGSNFPLLKDFVDTHRCGITVDPLDEAAIAEAIEYLLTHPEEAETMGRRGREAVERTFNWEIQAEKLLSMYASLA